MALAQAAGRSDAILAIESWREELLHRNPLDRKTQQLVHFALLIGFAQDKPAGVHAVGALRADATVHELFGVAETAAITGGMSVFSRAVEIISAAIAAMAEAP